MRAVCIAVLASLAVPSGLFAQDRPTPADTARAEAARAYQQRLEQYRDQQRTHDARAEAYQKDREAGAAATAPAAVGMTISGNDDDDDKQALSCWDRPGGCPAPALCVPPRVWNAQRTLCVAPGPR